MPPAPNIGSISTEDSSRFDPTTITRPDPALLQYYVVIALLTVVGFPFVILPLFFKYHTLKYRFDESGVSMSWGILFRREVHLTYRRIQDIHLTRNLIQRWMGLATVGIQTASGSSGPEMSIEGVLQAEQLRDYLYTEMRGAKGEVDLASGSGNVGALDATVPEDETLTLLRDIRDALRRLAKGQSEE
jgi:putative membrane protein